MHVAGVNADPATFEHIEPEVVGNSRELLVSELSGKGTVQARAQDAGIELDDAGAARVTERVKQLEHLGYHFEAADGSFELLLRKETGEYEPLFRLESWRAIVEKRADGRVETEATIKIWVGGERYVRTAEGNGPVNALDRALREALGEIHPHLRDIDLVNFKVRILDEDKGHGRGDPGAARRLRRRPRCGARSGSRRTSSRPRGRRSSNRWSTGCSRVAAARRAPRRRRRPDRERRADTARPAGDR